MQDVRTQEAFAIVGNLIPIAFRNQNKLNFAH